MKKLLENDLSLSKFIELVVMNPIAIIKDVRQRYINENKR